MGRTVAIIDFAHSGTTMLAGICEIFGVPMSGDDRHPWKIEDYEVIEAIQAGEEAFAAVVAQRSQDHNLWGFKWPGAWKFAPVLKAQLPEPIYLAIYKDVVSITRRRFGNTRPPWPRKIRNTGRQMKASIDGIYASRLPVRFLSYHDAIMDPLQFVKQVARVVELEPDEETLHRAASYIQPNRDRSQPRKPYPEVEPWIYPF